MARTYLNTSYPRPRWRQDHERVVRVSFEFLLEREAPSSILGEFSLDVIGRYFPEYEDELGHRLA